MLDLRFHLMCTVRYYFWNEWPLKDQEHHDVMWLVDLKKACYGKRVCCELLVMKTVRYYGWNGMIRRGGHRRSRISGGKESLSYPPFLYSQMRYRIGTLNRRGVGCKHCL